ncbi:MAG: hypothetical protein ACTIJN_00880 [Microbacterium gubbeenense]|uniref:hypothetical protein n=1 Tax=Microbacterium gubbeenense TaxID=159896 RepID=UPI003F995483
MPRTALALGAIVALAFGLTACVAEPEPEPEWTEETAYAEAEEVFRAYWSLDTDEQAELATPEMREVNEKGNARIKELGAEVRGKSVVQSLSFSGYRTVGDEVVVDLTACIDGSNVEVRIDDDDWKPAREDAVYGVVSQLESSDDDLLVAELSESGDAEC